MIIALFIFVGLLMASLIFTYIVNSALDSDKIYTEPAMDAVIQTNLALISVSTVDLVGDIISILAAQTMVFISGLPTQALNLARFGVVIGAAIVFHEGYNYFLSGGDTIFRTLLGPLFQDVLFSLFQLFRLAFDAVIPVYNYYSTIFGQLTSGSIAIAIRCDMAVVVQTIRLALLTFINLFRSVGDFAGDSSIYDNVLVNDWNITETVASAQLVVANQQKIASCICDGLTDVFDILFVLVGTKHLPKAVNHLWNVPVSILQDVAQILPPYSKMPVLTKTMYHLGSAGFEFATFADVVVITLIEKTLQLFMPELYLKGRPKQFIFATQSRLWLAIVEALHVMYRTVLHLVVPLPQFVGNPDFMMQAMSFKKPLLHLRLWLHGNANFLHWVLLLQQKFKEGFLRSARGNKFELTGIPEHVELNCYEIARQSYIKIPCASYLASELGVNLVYGAVTFLNEVFWKVIIAREKDFWRVLQTYDGMLTPRTVSQTCEYRRDEMNWDVTRGACKCEIPTENFKLEITKQHPFGRTDDVYDPYCNQFSMQAHVWNTYILSFRQAFEGTLLEATYTGVKTLQLMSLEFFRLWFRFILAFPDMVEVDFWKIPINCGWGTGDFSSCAVKKHTKNYANWCTDVNKEGCTCNPTLPLEYNNTCQCIYYFPDPEQEVTQEAFKNDLLTDLDNASHHWCNTYHFENLFSYADNFAYWIDTLISRFAPSYNTQSNNFCQSKEYTMLATDVLQYGQDEWQGYLVYNKSYEEKSCRLFGSYDMLCSASMTVRSGVFLVTQQSRAFLMTMIAFFDGDFQMFKLDVSERLCDVQRTAAALSSTLSGMFPAILVGKDIQRGIAMMLYSVFDLPIVMIRSINNLFLWVSDVFRGAVQGQNPEKATFQLLINQMNLFIDWTRRLLVAFGTFVNGIKSGAGKFFFTLENILKTLQSVLSEAMIEIVGLIFKVGIGMIEFFTTGRFVDGFLTDVFFLIKKFFAILLKNLGLVWGLLKEAIKPVFDVIDKLGGAVEVVKTSIKEVGKVAEAGIASAKAAASAIGSAIRPICNTIEDVICKISLGGSCNMGCSALRSSRYDNPVHKLFYSNPNTPMYMASSVPWEGDTKCDLMMHMYKNYTWNQLRPTEKLDLMYCIEQRHLAQVVINITKLPLPEDMFYNWKRKYEIGYDAFHAIVIYGRHLMGDLTTTEMMKIMKRDNIRLDIYLPLLSKLKILAKKTLTVENADKAVHHIFNQIPNIDTQNTATGHVYRIYKHMSNFTRQATPDLNKIASEYTQLSNVVQRIPHRPKLMHAFDFKQRIFNLRKSLSSIPPILYKHRSMKPSKIKARQFFSHVLGAAGINADIRPCHEQEDSYVCLNCVVIDNLLNTVIKEGGRMTDYYINTYAGVVIPSFIDYFEQQEKRAKSYREDMAASLQRAAEKATENITEPRLRNTFNRTLTPWQLAQKDWTYLWENWAVRNNRDIIDIFSQFLSTSDSSYVPFFGNGLGYIITYPFVEACPMETIYCTTSTTQQRLQYISDQWGYQLAFWGGLYAGQVYTGTPMFNLAVMFPYNAVFAIGIYMYSVYGYLYTCSPNIPNCLVDDLFAWTHDVAYPQCFCQYYPGLADACDPELCFLSSRSTAFSNCSAEVPLSANENMGYLWSPVFWVRKEFPDFFLFLYKTPPFSWILRNFEGIKDIAVRLQEDIPITLAEIDCLGLRYTDLVLIGVVVYVLSFFLSIILPIGTRLTVHFFKMSIIFFNTLFAFSVATEVSTVVGISNNYKE